MAVKTSVVVQVVNVTDLNVTLSGLIPFARYRASVKCIPLDEYNTSNLSPRGYWSDALDREITTESDGRPAVVNITLR